MRSDLPLTVYYDASCSLCHNELMNIKLHDTRNHLRLVDCSAPGFDDSPFHAEGVTLEHMMERLHVRDNQGAWIKGVAAMELVYRSAGMQRMASLWGPRTLMGRMYPWIARNRHGISRTGIPLLFSLWGKLAARRAYRRSQGCKNGQCSVK
jgi:predicted DCC family thiol-disulfide oxidoreductase YuxK